MKKEYRKEGYWYSEDKENINYPKPESTKDKGWKKRKQFFLNHLARVESSPFTHSRHFKGWSNCRLCDERCGSSTFYYKGWEWPSGLSHYIEDHNVKPSQHFIDFMQICGAMLKLLKD